jgi:hypothetical protein
MQAMSVAPVKVSTTPIFPTIPRGQTNKDFQVLLRVEAPPAADLNSHVPLDVVAVLDVSGSMNDPVAAASPKSNLQGSRLDLLKASMKFVIRKLDDGDRLSIVAFNDGPVKEYSSGLLDVSGDGRSIAGKKIDRLQARGGTALMPALEEAVKVCTIICKFGKILPSPAIKTHVVCTYFKSNFQNLKIDTFIILSQ